MKYYLAIDIGASSGRHIVGYMENNNIQTIETYRFKNGVIRKNDHLFWDIDYLVKEVKNGIKESLKRFKTIESLAIDTWGVDYILLNNDNVIGLPYAYRDERTLSVLDEVHSIMPFKELYSRTGIANNSFNTIYQLFVDKKNGLLDKATDFLHIPEYINYCLTGVKMKEYTMASTTGLINVDTKEYDLDIINKLGFNKKLFKELHEGGETVGYFKDEVANEVGGNIKVKLCFSHDTASAVYAVNTNDPYISSGTWSLLGVVDNKAHTDDYSRENNFTNEGGVNRTFRYLKNIMGMWIINNIANENNSNPVELKDLAYKSDYNVTFNVNDSELLSPVNMTEAVKNVINKEGNIAPIELKDLARSVLLSLAKEYASSIKTIEKTTGKTYDSITIVGGGAKNELLNKFTEDFSGKKVIALPIEATAIGNLKIQMEE